jgi:hypothetical protein
MPRYRHGPKALIARRPELGKSADHPLRALGEVAVSLPGGTLLVGVADDGAIVGIEEDFCVPREEERRRVELWLTDMLAASLGKAAATDVSLSYGEIADRTVARIVVGPAAQRVFTTPAKGVCKPVFLVRINSSTRELPGQAGPRVPAQALAGVTGLGGGPGPRPNARQIRRPAWLGARPAAAPGVYAGVGQRFGGPGAPAGAGRRRRPRMRRLPVRPQHRAAAVPAAGSRSVVRPVCRPQIIRCESLRF